MVGQFIKLPGVTAASTAGVPRIVMGEADIAALRVPSLAHVVSAKSLATASAGGVMGRCRATGKALIPKGTTASLQLRTVGGFIGLGVSGVAAAALALPAGSASASYTAVIAVQVGQTDIDGSAPANFLYTQTAAGVDVATVLRYYGKAYTGSTGPDNFAASGSNTLSGANQPWVNKVRPEGTWAIVAIDFNDLTKVLSMSTNGSAFLSAVKTANHVPGVDGYFTLGYPSSTASFRASLVGDLYLFNDSLMKTPLGQSQLADVIAGLKTDYGIA